MLSLRRRGVAPGFSCSPSPRTCGSSLPRQRAGGGDLIRIIPRCQSRSISPTPYRLALHGHLCQPNRNNLPVGIMPQVVNARPAGPLRSDICELQNPPEGVVHHARGDPPVPGGEEEVFVGHGYCTADAEVDRERPSSSDGGERGDSFRTWPSDHEGVRFGHLLSRRGPQAPTPGAPPREFFFGKGGEVATSP